jgi:hypothetical protein
MESNRIVEPRHVVALQRPYPPPRYLCRPLWASDERKRRRLMFYPVETDYLVLATRFSDGGGFTRVAHGLNRSNYPEVDCSTGVAIPFVGVCTSDECSVVGSRGNPITGSPITYRSTSLSVMIPTSLPCVGPVPPSTTTSRCTRRCRRSANSLPSESYCVQVITPGKSRER